MVFFPGMDQHPPQITSTPAATQRANIPPGHIGYYNHTRSPLTFTSAYGNRGPATVEPGEAVRDLQSRLVAYDPDLERMVLDKCLKRIMPGDPRYGQFVKESQVIERRNQIPTSAPSESPVGAAHDVGDSKKLEYTQEIVDNTVYLVFEGQRFPSLAAMNAYARSIGKLQVAAAATA